jgi:hypothetical protein
MVTEMSSLINIPQVTENIAKNVRLRDKRIILKCILKNYGARAWTGFNCPRITLY